MFHNRIAQAFVIGSLSFWLPIEIAFAVFGPERGGTMTMFVLTFCLPLLCCFVLEAFATKWNQACSRLVPAMLLGIWATGPFWIIVANTSTPGLGFHMAGAWTYLGLTTATFPMSLIMMATYHGSLFALFLTTAAVALFAAAGWSFKPLLRRCIICRLANSHTI